MSEPPVKRRRTNSPEQRAASPLKQPPRRRPSFASPTKASLARGYPHILASTSTLAPSPKRSTHEDMLARGEQARAFVLGETEVHPGPLGEGFEEEGEATGGAQEAPGDQNTTPRERKINPMASGSAPIDAGELNQDETELPATPSQKGLEQDAPRRGVLFSSPSKRPPRVKDPVKQSLLKPKAPAVQSDDLTRTVGDGPADVGAKDANQKRQRPDPEIERRKQEKAQLEREVEELEAEVSRCTEEVAKEQKRAPDEALRLAEQADLNKFISKIAGLNTEKEKPAPTSSLLCSFLPFSAFSVPQPRSKQPAKPIPSHRPVKVADPMLYLEMFTSFKLSTQLSLPRGKVFPASRRVHQKHTIDIAGPQKLLTAQVSIHLDALANAIIDMHILRISPWAERELGTFVRGKAQEKDLGNTCWAIDSYWELARKRAEYWQKCESTFAHLITGRTNDDTENVRPQMMKSAKALSRRDLNRHLGRDMLVLQDKHVLLKLNWCISFDWTGEAASDVSVEPAFPQVWSETDSAASLKKVPGTFASLLRTRGAYMATRIMVDLLFPQ